MKKFILLLFFSSSIRGSDNLGCGGLHLRTSNGISYYGTERFGPFKNVTIAGLDSFEITIFQSGNPYCMNCRKCYILLNSDTIISNSSCGNTNKVFKFFELPGHYKVSCIWDLYGMGNQFVWEFDLILKPVEVDSTEEETVLPVIMALNQEFLLYPNPAENTISFSNETEQIKTAVVSNLNGQMILAFEVNNTKADLPLNNLPPGIYFLQVATASEKVIIKKFVVMN